MRTIIMKTRPNITLYVHRLSCFNKFTTQAKSSAFDGFYEITVFFFSILREVFSNLKQT